MELVTGDKQNLLIILKYTSFYLNLPSHNTDTHPRTVKETEFSFHQRYLSEASVSEPKNSTEDPIKKRQRNNPNNSQKVNASVANFILSK